MSVRTAHLKHYCRECAAIVDHVRLTYTDQEVLICMLCQNEVIKEPMKKTYTIVSIHDSGYNAKARRAIVVEVQCDSEPDKVGEQNSRTETLMVSYPAYNGDHFTASICKHPGAGYINHVEATAIAIEIKKFVGKKGN